MIIIPDIHGRTFWKEAVKGNESEDIVFLGDYLDPYSSEGITSEAAVANLKDILAFKHEHDGNVTLLLGNHDLGYLCTDINMCRHDNNRHEEICQLLSDNLKDFQLCTSREFVGKTYFFSHSLLNTYWLEVCKQYLHVDFGLPSEIANMLNRKFVEEKEKMFELLALVSIHRGGALAFGSLVWSDLLEVRLPDVFVDGIYNIFGHTQVREPIICSRFACIDNKRAFSIDSKGEITRL